MPQPRTTSRTALSRLLFLAVLGWALVALGRRTSEETEGTFAAAELDGTPAGGLEPRPTRVRVRKRTRKKRLATSLAFATLFFAGAALSAGAGDMLVGSMEPSASEGDTATTTETTAEDPASGEEAPAEEPTEAPAEEPAETEPPADDGSTPAEGSESGESTDPGEATEPGEGSEPGETTDPGDEPAEAPGDGDSPSGHAGDGDEGGQGGGADAPPAPKGPPVVAPHSHDDQTGQLDPETGMFGGATVWLHRTLPDPTPPARRLAPRWAKMLRTESSAAGSSWARVLAAVRANGHIGRTPASKATVRSLARRLAATARRGEWNSFLALSGRTSWADRAQAFARYNRAVGLHALVVGLDASKRTLERKVLNDARLSIYPGGRSDVAGHGIDVRVLVLLRYLAEAHGSVTVSSLHSGHRYYSRPGVVSAHTYGLAVDVAALGGVPIYGHSQPGGVTEEGVRNVLLLPAELRPRQVISLLGLGGPSFPLADHDDHIHVGF